MAGKIRIFEKTASGLLTEVDPASIDKGRMISRVHITIDVLWTAEEEAQRKAEEAAFLAERDAQIKAQQEADRKRSVTRDAATAKLRKLGLSVEEIESLK